MTRIRRIAKHAVTAAKNNKAMCVKAQDLFKEVGFDVAKMPPVRGYKGRWVVVQAEGEAGEAGELVVMAEMTCVRCEKEQPRDLDHFAANGGKTIETALPGQESMRNSKARPCKECQRTNLTEREWARQIGKSYRMTVDAVLALFNDPRFTRCPYTLFPRKYMTLGPNRQWAPGINGTKLATGERYRQDHHGKDVEAVLAIANIPQGSKDRVYVVSLSWLPVYKGMTVYARIVMRGLLEANNKRLVAAVHRRMVMKTKESGVTAIKARDRNEYQVQKRKFHLKEFLRMMASGHSRDDLMKGRPNDMPNAEDYLKRIVAQNGRCALSMVPFELVNGAMGPSPDRPENKGGHTHDNVRMILRLFQCGNHYIMTRRRLIHMYLVAGVAPSPEIVEYYLCEHDLLAETGEQCAACDTDVPLPQLKYIN
jgi:hypothetical protein